MTTLTAPAPALASTAERIGRACIVCRTTSDSQAMCDVFWRGPAVDDGHQWAFRMGLAALFGSRDEAVSALAGIYGPDWRTDPEATDCRFITSGPLPGLSTHQGRQVTWQPWEVQIEPLCTKWRTVCATRGCKDTGPPWATTGKVAPLPGETFQSVDADGDETSVPAWPVYQLHATRCPTCQVLTVYDLGRDGTGFVEVKPEPAPTLF